MSDICTVQCDAKNAQCHKQGDSWLTGLNEGSYSLRLCD